ncbi:hypothetical protein KOR42_22800 [Thalassoglobus neptunius]|uniref:Uncharacterized protein n=1 Tax=Thalassoglobus neptunius TaxID=1938619 RepID=A0A5C5X9A6_9PLAN|nr:hypothetical protein [Thalassoglobus neptunius]TWT58893.1 hypothetical protein KOR42_22800 [Thalassoglobus neptunius]
MEGLTLPDSFTARRLTKLYEEDFSKFNADHYDTDGTVAAPDSADGGVSIATAATDNDPAFLALKPELFKFVDGKPFLFESCISFTDANSNDDALAIGLVDGNAAGLIADGGAALRAGNIDGCLFVKYKDQSYWTVVTSRGAAGVRQSDALIESNKNNLAGAVQTANGANKVVLGIHGFSRGAYFDVAYTINGVVVCKHFNVDIASATEMQPTLYHKAGSTNIQTLYAFWQQGAQKR